MLSSRESHWQVGNAVYFVADPNNRRALLHPGLIISIDVGAAGGPVCRLQLLGLAGSEVLRVHDLDFAPKPVRAL